jgi:hypothetical protein
LFSVLLQSARIAPLIEHLLDQIESEYGHMFTAIALAFVCCAPDESVCGGGLLEEELRRLVDLFMALSNNNHIIDLIPKCVSLLDFRSLFRPDDSLEKNRTRIGTAHFVSFVDVIVRAFCEHRPTAHAPIRLRRNALIEGVIKHRYAPANNVTVVGSRITCTKLPSAIVVHRLMAIHYLNLVNEPLDIATSLTSSPRALCRLPFHLSHGGCASDLSVLLCDLSFLAAKCEHGLGAQLMNDFDLHARTESKAAFTSIKTKSVSASLSIIDATKRLLDLSPRFSSYKTFVKTNQHIFSRASGARANVVYQQALNEAPNSQLAKDVRVLLKAQNSTRSLASFLFEKLNGATSNMNKQQSIVKIANFDEAVSAVAISPDSKTVACGTFTGIGRSYF